MYLICFDDNDSLFLRKTQFEIEKMDSQETPDALIERYLQAKFDNCDNDWQYECRQEVEM